MDILANFFQKLTHFFRRIYIFSLRSFVIKYDPKELKKETYENLPEELKKQFSVYEKCFEDLFNSLKEREKYWDGEINNISKLSEDKLFDRVYTALGSEPSRKQALACDKAIKGLNAARKLYLASFNNRLMLKQVKSELSKLGFRPANLLETILFFQKYKEKIRKYQPIIVPEAYFDNDSKIGLLQNDLYALCIYSDYEDIKFARIGSLESDEFLQGACFRENVCILSIPIS